jgi:hypothetical protein
MIAQHDERVLKRLVDLAEVKQRWLLKDFRQLIRGPAPPAVRRGCSAATVHGDGRRRASSRRQDILEPYRELPVVAVVVSVGQDLARNLDRLVQPYGGGRGTAFVLELALLDIPGTQKHLT